MFGTKIKTYKVLLENADLITIKFLQIIYVFKRRLMMKKLYFSLLTIALFSLLVAGCGGGSGTPLTDEEAINNVMDGFANGMRAENVVQVAACFTDIIIYEGVSMSLADFKLLIQSFFNTKTIIDYQVIERTISIVNSGAATVTGKVLSSDLELTDHISPLMVFNLVKQGRTWKISSLGLML